MIIDWRVLKTTADKLEQVLIEETERGYDIHTIAYQGGRDWVVVACKDVYQGAQDGR